MRRVPNARCSYFKAELKPYGGAKESQPEASALFDGLTHAGTTGRASFSCWCCRRLVLQEGSTLPRGLTPCTPVGAAAGSAASA